MDPISARYPKVAVSPPSLMLNPKGITASYLFSNHVSTLQGLLGSHVSLLSWLEPGKRQECPVGVAAGTVCTVCRKGSSSTLVLPLHCYLLSLPKQHQIIETINLCREWKCTHLNPVPNAKSPNYYHMLALLAAIGPSRSQYPKGMIDSHPSEAVGPEHSLMTFSS